MAKNIADVAVSQLGYSEQGDNRTKYGAWFGMDGAAWCHMFVSWCANEAGIPNSVVPKTASCSEGMQWFKDRGLFKYKGSYTPKRNDIVYFCTNRSHVGIVLKVSGNMLYTIEGNTSNKVAMRTYILTDATITGYGTPNYSDNNSFIAPVSESGGSVVKTSKNELKYLKSILKKKETKPANISAEVQAPNILPEVNVTVTVTNGNKVFVIPVEKGMKIVWERKGMPGKLTFAAKYEDEFKIVEGNSVLVTIGDKNFFLGFIFTRQMSKNGIMQYTAYDQLRYLKNKDTLVYKKKRADEVIKIIAKRFKLNCGKMTNTAYRMSAVEDNATLFDIIQNALDNTLMVKGVVYILYDECGKLRLQKPSSMKVNDCLVDEETGEDFTYKTTIDENVYNQIKLIYENKKKGSFDLYVAKHSKNINKWGVLQYVEKIDDPDVGKIKSKALLKIYNKKQRTLTISKVIGNKNVRAGSLVPVLLNLGDIKVGNYMMVEKVTHTFDNNHHSMDLIVSGGDFSG